MIRMLIASVTCTNEQRLATFRTNLSERMFAQTLTLSSPSAPDQAMQDGLEVILSCTIHYVLEKKLGPIFRLSGSMQMETNQTKSRLRIF